MLLVQCNLDIGFRCKLRVGVCQRGCGRKVTAENLTAFDWAHMDRSTKTTNISTLCHKSKKAYFKKQWPIERLKCELLCCMCHKTETDEENKMVSAEEGIKDN